MRTRYAASIIQDKRARVLTLHLASLDHIEHETGPGSAKAFAALEEIDKMIAVLEQAIRSVAKDAAVCVVSDHGMARVEHELNLRVAFIQAGLMSPAGGQRTAGGAPIADWRAQPWIAGGSAAILLKDPSDQETASKVSSLLKALSSDPKNGIAAVLDRKAIAQLGGSPDAAFWVDLKPGFAMGSAMTGPLTRSVPVKGTHGYAPTHPEMAASFFLAGPGVPKGTSLGAIDLRSVAPTLAKLLGVSLAGTDLKPLPGI
jgi:predicted AlkP superfamily pyrophosphatase or phosphodiesterase